MLTQSRLKELLSYDASTGVFTWLVNTRNTIAGNRAGAFRKDGYEYIGVDGQRYLAHRLAWLYVNGSFPEMVIDHINGNQSDNRIINLRDVAHKTNQQNIRSPHKDSSSGCLGVSRSLKKWRAHLCVDGKFIYLGTFSTKEEAHQAYVVAKRDRHSGCTL
jgi:hypothetical protein